MKYVVRILLVVFALVTFSLNANAQQTNTHTAPTKHHHHVVPPYIIQLLVAGNINTGGTTAPTRTKWNMWSVVTMDSSEKYSMSYSVEQCFIYVYRDGSGVEISAMNPDFLDSSKKPVFQTIIIKKDKDGVVRFDDGITTHHLITPPTSKDVFYTYYREDAKYLPSDIKKLFLGQYGIE